MVNNQKISDFSKRLNHAMTLKNIRQVDLIEKTGIKKASMSHYVRGTRTDVSLDVVQTLANALEVDPVWLLGYDVPMNKETFNKDSAVVLADTFNDSLAFEISKVVSKLDDNKKETLLQYAKFLLSQ